jgi:formylglycine-generating enzyme required for sulfatase activity
MIFIKAGTFMMGKPGATGKWMERVKGTKIVYMNHYYHSVTLTKSYWIGKYELLQKEWEAIMGSNPSKHKGERKPVDSISWFEMQKFCKKLTEKEATAGRIPAEYAYRLPTEAEWENAAKGGVDCKDEFKYSGNNDAEEVAWHGNNADKQSHEAGQKKPNQLGFYDMSGNAWEWVLDLAENTGKATSNIDYMITNTYVDSIIDPLSIEGPMPVRRGGSWQYGDYNYNQAVYNRRMLYGPKRTSDRIGFRIVLAIDKKAGKPTKSVKKNKKVK